MSLQQLEKEAWFKPLVGMGRSALIGTKDMANKAGHGLKDKTIGEIATKGVNTIKNATPGQVLGRAKSLITGSKLNNGTVRQKSIESAKVAGTRGALGVGAIAGANTAIGN